MTSVIGKRARAIVGVVAIVAVASVAYGDLVPSLTSGVPVPGLSGGAGSEAYYKIDVPDGQGELQISISGGTGDCDLYVRRGGPPSDWTYDYRPYLAGNDETVVVDYPAVDTWYIMLRGRSAYSGVTLVAQYQPLVPVALSNGVPQYNLFGHDNSRLYSIDVPAGQNVLVVDTWGGTGDVDLFVKAGSAPDSSGSDGSSTGPGTRETVTISNPAAGTWYILLHASNHYNDVNVRALYSTSGTPATLSDGVTLTGLSGALGSQTLYVIDVPADVDAVDFVLSGGTGDCDLYVKKDLWPTTSDWDYRPVDLGNSESISISGSNLPGSWYVLLVGNQAYSGVTLRADFVRWQKPAPEGDVQRLTQGVAVTNLSGQAGSQQYFSIDVPADATNLVIKLSNGTGDADLYIRQGALPTTADYDYRPYMTGNNEQQIVSKPAAGTWYIMVRGYQAFTGATLLVTFDTPKVEDALVLASGVPLTGLAAGAGSENYYKIVVPPGQSRLEISTSGGVGDVDLYVRLGEKPTTREWDYRPFLMGNNEKVSIDEPKAGTYYIMLRGYLFYHNVTLLATYGPPLDQVKALANCVPVTGLSGAQDSEVLFKIDVPAGQASLRIAISGGTGDADLFVKKGAQPTTKSWDYHPGLHGNDEAVDISSPAAATWYIMVQGYQAYAGVTLQACYQAANQDDGGDGGDDDCGCGGGSTDDGSVIIYFP